MGLLKVSALGIGSTIAAYFAWRILTVFFVISVLIVKIAICVALVMFAIWAFRRLMAPVRSDSTI